MAWARGQNRLAGDYGLAGAAIGLVVSIIQFVVLIGLAYRIDNSGRGAGALGCTCVLRLLAILGLTLGTGIGYLVARALFG